MWGRQKSDRWIAEKCGVGKSGQLVAQVRAELHESCSSDDAPRTGRDGKKRKNLAIQILRAAATRTRGPDTAKTSENDHSPQHERRHLSVRAGGRAADSGRIRRFLVLKRGGARVE